MLGPQKGASWYDHAWSSRPLRVDTPESRVTLIVEPSEIHAHRTAVSLACLANKSSSFFIYFYYLLPSTSTIVSTNNTCTQSIVICNGRGCFFFLPLLVAADVRRTFWYTMILPPAAVPNEARLALSPGRRTTHTCLYLLS